MVDYSFHQIINDPFDEVIIAEDVPAIVASGHPQPEGLPHL